MKIKINVPRGVETKGLIFLRDSSATCYYLIGITLANDPRIALQSLKEELASVEKRISLAEAEGPGSSEVDVKLLTVYKDRVAEQVDALENITFSPVDMNLAQRNPFRQELLALTVNSVPQRHNIGSLVEHIESPSSVVPRVDGTQDLVFEAAKLSAMSLKQILRSLGESGELLDYFVKSGGEVSYQWEMPAFRRQSLYVSLYNRRVVVD